MAETNFAVSDVDPETLTGVVRHALRSDTVEITDWQYTRLHIPRLTRHPEACIAWPDRERMERSFSHGLLS